ncbi:hypothetical protein [Amycolatopsis sp. CA-230715]|uniref:hypothetical protein n=1 Tax=Amycolatopsis sp. CA-230715 TaxID=2745196 RepID=UPI001C010384|nr:hypothetical protein [Amycolatopsis sp. CA-230715]QWF77144.1 hypothetical protein HUW46_00524 [Amycolatopsis sp. CA-230715]
MSEFGRRDSEDEGASGRPARRDDKPRGGRSGAPRGGNRNAGGRQDRGGRDGGYQGRPRRDDRGDRGDRGGKPPFGRDARGGDRFRGEAPKSGQRRFGDDRKGPGDDRRSGGYRGGKPGDKPTGKAPYGRDDRREGPSRQGGRWEDRGPRTGGARGDKPAYGNRADKPAYRDRGEKPAYGNRDRNDKPPFRDHGDKPAYGNRNRDDKPPFRDRNDKPAHGNRADKPSFRDRGDKPVHGDRDRAGKPSYGDRGDKPSYRDREDKPAYGNRDRRDGPSRGDDRRGAGRPRDTRDGRPEFKPRRDTRSPHVNEAPLDDEALAKELLEAPELPEGIEFSDLDEEARRELRTLPKALAETVGKHLVAAGSLMDDDSDAALEHARYAKAKASRVPIVREALGLVAYHTGNWAEALSELRAVRRMTRSEAHIAVIADAERALGRPERALDLAKEANVGALPREVQIELRIVAAGARRDLGQLDAAVVSLQGDDLDTRKREPWSARLFYAYADNLAAAGRKDEAVRWFLNAAEADDEDATDAAERAAELADG